MIARRTAEKAAADKQKQAQQEAQQMQRLRAGIATDGFLPYKPLLDQERGGLYEEVRKVYQNPNLNSTDRQSLAEERIASYNSRVNWTKQLESRFKDVVRLSSAAGAPYNPAAVDAALQATLKDKEGNILPPGTYNPDVASAVLDNPNTFDRTAVATRFLDQLAEADSSTVSTAATPGRYGQRNTATSNFFEVEDGAFKLDPATGRRIARTSRPEVVEAARRDPFVSKLIDQQMQAHAATVAGVVEKMRAFEPLTEQEQQLVEQEQTGPKRYVQYLDELLLPHAYQRSSEIQTYARPVAAKTPKAAAKKPASEITVTPTVGYQASTYTPEPSGLRQRTMKAALGIDPARVTNHYPTVGVTFASARSPFAEVMVDNRGAEVVGQNGTTTKLAQGNGKVPARITSRDLALYINGKRVGRTQAFTSDTDAYTYLLQTIEGLTPEQARKAELRAEYRGSITDKARTLNSGTGGQNAAGNREPAETSPKGANPWDASETEGRSSGPTATEQSVIIQANQTTDAQLQRASGGTWNPRRLTPEQSRAVEALKRKGGRLIDPYTQTPTTGQQPQPALKKTGVDWGVPDSRPATGSGDKYRKKDKVVLRIGVPDPSKSELVGKKDVLGFGTSSPANRGGAY
ncbi:hypothetical protein KLP40_02780 [Hymenobacter sp. NST-14]|uniref:hypothetical protein n=1 Tax=Hymenobacter piscis TaxID=2839984 RepID=UPI001C02EE72|nr:hypothetical protein [Hymenobacter piscis]MBT9392078.1 hypothetical protein [Hymenobacter piscis]